MHTKDFKDLCEKFAMAFNQLRSSQKDGLLSQDKFKDICKSIAQQVAPAMLCRCTAPALSCARASAVGG